MATMRLFVQTPDAGESGYRILTASRPPENFEVAEVIVRPVFELAQKWWTSRSQDATIAMEPIVTKESLGVVHFVKQRGSNRIAPELIVAAGGDFASGSDEVRVQAVDTLKMKLNSIRELVNDGSIAWEKQSSHIQHHPTLMVWCKELEKIVAERAVESSALERKTTGANVSGAIAALAVGLVLAVAWFFFSRQMVEQSPSVPPITIGSPQSSSAEPAGEEDAGAKELTTASAKVETLEIAKAVEKAEKIVKDLRDNILREPESMRSLIETKLKKLIELHLPDEKKTYYLNEISNIEKENEEKYKKKPNSDESRLERRKWLDFLEILNQFQAFAAGPASGAADSLLRACGEFLEIKDSSSARIEESREWANDLEKHLQDWQERGGPPARWLQFTPGANAVAQDVTISVKEGRDRQSHIVLTANQNASQFYNRAKNVFTFQAEAQRRGISSLRGPRQETVTLELGELTGPINICFFEETDDPGRVNLKITSGDEAWIQISLGMAGKLIDKYGIKKKHEKTNDLPARNN